MTLWRVPGGVLKKGPRMDDGVSALIEGAKAAQLELAAMDARADAATIAALKKVQSLTAARVRSRLRGRPRWSHRGQGLRWKFVKPFDTGGGKSHITRSGGPGRFTGTLGGAVKGSRRPRRKGFGTYSAIVFVGSKNGKIVNIYKSKLEGKYPYFKPGVKSAEPKMPAVWEAAYAKATKTTK
jgi:hypothetical protein